jgi:hypothetical protein
LIGLGGIEADKPVSAAELQKVERGLPLCRPSNSGLRLQRLRVKAFWDAERPPAGKGVASHHAHLVEIGGATRHVSGVAGIEDRPDEGTLLTHLVDCSPDGVVGQQVLDLESLSVPAADIDRNKRLGEAVGLVSPAEVRDLHAVASEEEHNEVAAPGACRQIVKRPHDVRVRWAAWPTLSARARDGGILSQNFR